MRKKKNYRYFTRNRQLVSVLLAIGIGILLLTIAFILVSLPIWVIMPIGCTAVLFIIVSIIITVLYRCKISYEGITVSISHKQKQFLSWNDIKSVQIQCEIARDVIYLIELKSDDRTININTYRGVVEAIQVFSQNFDNFHQMFVERLHEAKKKCYYG